MLKGTVLIICAAARCWEELAGHLVQRGFAVLTAAAIEDARKSAHSNGPDVIVLDEDTSDLDGPRACQEIRKSSSAPIILLSSRSDETDVVLGLGLGADHYLIKPVKTSELLAYIESAARRETLYSHSTTQPDILRVKDLVLDISAHELRRDDATIPLSKTEFKLVQALAVNAGRILSRDQLLDSVWNCQSNGVFSRTVDVHIARIRRKIGDTAAGQLYITTIPGLGYRMPSA